MVALLVAPLTAAIGRTARDGGASGRSHGPQGSSGSRGGTMDFNAVVAGNHSPNPCTPKIPEDFIGLRINAPTKVVSGVDQFVICGTYRFTAQYVYTFPDVHDAVVLVAVDAARHRPLACTLRHPGSDPPPTRSRARAPVEPDWVGRHSVQSFFNVDLMTVMQRLPAGTADYYIYALIEDHISNVVRVSFRA
jgi:hypothetical protein